MLRRKPKPLRKIRKTTVCIYIYGIYIYIWYIYIYGIYMVYDIYIYMLPRFASATGFYEMLRKCEANFQDGFDTSTRLKTMDPVVSSRT